MALVVGLDGDDTLWHNERIFSMTESRFVSLLGPYAGDAEITGRLLATERRNLDVFGYGVKSFTLSMIETAIEVSGGEVPAKVIDEIIAAGKEMMEHPVELLDGAAETVGAIAARWPIVLITKGDLFHQESKLARSGLLEHFWRVEIVSDKTVDTYRRILDASDVDAADFVMVGDSVRSDIIPVLELGGRAVHVPGFREWALEAGEVGPAHVGRWWQLEALAEVPALLAAVELQP